MYFAKKNDAKKFAEEILQVVPARKKQETKSHVGTDVQNNLSRFKFTTVIEVSPICKHDLVILNNKLQGSLFGGRSSLVLCEQVTTSLKFLDPSTLDEGEYE